MWIEDQSRPLQRALTTNSSASSFASKVYTVTEPTNDGVLNLTFNKTLVPSRILLIPIGLGADDDAFSVRIIGWHKVTKAAVTTGWVPTIIAELGVVVGTAVGVAASAVLNTERFPDTITIVSEGTTTADTTRRGTVELHSPGSNLIGHAIVPIGGFEKIEFTFDQTTGTPTMNVLYAYL